MHIVSSAVSYIPSDIKGEINHFSLSAHHMKWGESGALVVRFCDTCPKSLQILAQASPGS